MNLNKAFILGNVTRDPEIRQTPSGQSVAVFGIATNRFFTNASGQKQQQAEFHNIVAWGRLAEICGQYLKKGSLVLIEGRMQTRSWQDPQGNTRNKTEIVAERMQLGPRPAGQRNEAGGNMENRGEAAPVQEPTPVIELPDENEEINVKDIPF